MDTVTVSTKDEFVAEVMNYVEEQTDGTDISEGAAGEMWELWAEFENNGPDRYLVVIPFWLCEEKFGSRKPFFLADVEYDNDDKAAILWNDVRTVDKNILEAGMWEDVSMSEALEEVDFSEDEDAYVDDPGMTWTPRSMHRIFDYDG